LLEQVSVSKNDDSGALGSITLGTTIATTSGTLHDFTGLTGAKMIIFSMNAVSTTGSSAFILQLGDSGGFETSGYTGTFRNETGSSAMVTAGFNLNLSSGAAFVFQGSARLTLIDEINNIWSYVIQSVNSFSNQVGDGAATKTISAELTQLRLTTIGGSDTFDAGSVNISTIS